MCDPEAPTVYYLGRRVWYDGYKAEIVVVGEGEALHSYRIQYVDDHGWLVRKWVPGSELAPRRTWWSWSFQW